MAPDESETNKFRWGQLVARVLHPKQVAIIEAMYWIDQSLSAADLAEIVHSHQSHLVHHLRRLTHIRAIEPAENPTPRNMATIRFRLKVAQRDNEH